jgi:iron complex transport system ATP-binding protein
MSAYFGAYGVSFSVGKLQILREISFEMEKGEILALLGPNGVGKSSLLKILAGIQSPTENALIRLRSQELNRMGPLARAQRVTYVGAELISHFPMTAYEVVSMGRFCHPHFNEALIQKSMQDCMCWDLRDREIHSLSGGERQLVALARAFAQEPQLILLDESLSKMDLNHQAFVGKLLKERAALGQTFILVSHDLNLASEFSNRAILLIEGRVAAQGVLSEVLTLENLKRAYPGAAIRVGTNPATGSVQIFFT